MEETTQNQSPPQAQSQEASGEQVQEQGQAKTQEQGPPQAFLDEMKALRQERADLRAKVEELTGQVSTIGELQGQLDNARRDLSLAKEGLTDPEAIAIAETLYNRLPKTDRPSLPDWINQSKEAGTLPKALSPYFSTSDATGGGPSSLPADVGAGGPSLPQNAPGTITEQAPSAPVDPKARLQAATDKLNNLRRLGGSADQMTQARVELQAALTGLRK